MYPGAEYFIEWIALEIQFAILTGLFFYLFLKIKDLEKKMESS